MRPYSWPDRADIDCSFGFSFRGCMLTQWPPPPLARCFSLQLVWCLPLSILDPHVALQSQSQNRSLQRAFRERSGRALQAKINGPKKSMFVFGAADKFVLSSISKASKNRDWQGVQSSVSTYTGNAVPVYTAALHAAGASIYDKFRAVSTDLDAPAFSAALRICGSLQEFLSAFAVFGMKRCQLVSSRFWHSPGFVQRPMRVMWKLLLQWLIWWLLKEWKLRYTI